MSKIIGVRSSSFKGQDGTMISGLMLWLSSPITKNGFGDSTERIFMSDKKAAEPLALAGGTMQSLLGLECVVLYNRYGKVERLDFPELK